MGTDTKHKTTNTAKKTSGSTRSQESMHPLDDTFGIRLVKTSSTAQ
jgi:hypothetical protein